MECEKPEGNLTISLLEANTKPLILRDFLGNICIDATADQINRQRLKGSHIGDETYNFGVAQQLSSEQITPERRASYAGFMANQLAEQQAKIFREMSPAQIKNLTFEEKMCFDAFQKANMLRQAVEESAKGINWRSQTLGIVPSESDSLRVLTELALEARIKYLSLFEKDAFDYVDHYEVKLLSRREALRLALIATGSTFVGGGLTAVLTGCGPTTETEKSVIGNCQYRSFQEELELLRKPIPECDPAPTIERVLMGSSDEEIAACMLAMEEERCGIIIPEETKTAFIKSFHMDRMEVVDPKKGLHLIGKLFQGGAFSGIMKKIYSDGSLHITVYDAVNNIRQSWDVVNGVASKVHITFPDGMHLEQWEWIIESLK